MIEANEVTVSIYGRRGVGKTTILEHVRNALENAGFQCHLQPEELADGQNSTPRSQETMVIRFPQMRPFDRAGVASGEYSPEAGSIVRR